MKPGRRVVWLRLSGTTIIVMIFITYFYLVEKSLLKFYELDFNHIGYESFFKLYYANSYGTRNITLKDTSCIKHYALKDNVRLKLEYDK